MPIRRVCECPRPSDEMRDATRKGKGAKTTKTMGTRYGQVIPTLSPIAGSDSLVGHHVLPVLAPLLLALDLVPRTLPAVLVDPDAPEAL